MLTQSARQIAKGNISVELSESGNDEIGQITGAFKEIVDVLTELRNTFKNAQADIKCGDILRKIDNRMLNGIFKDILTETDDIIYEFVKLFGLVSEPIIIIDTIT